MTFGYSQRYTLIEARGPRRVSGLERLLERPTRRSHLKPHPLAGRGFSFLSFGTDLQAPPLRACQFARRRNLEQYMQQGQSIVVPFGTGKVLVSQCNTSRDWAAPRGPRRRHIMTKWPHHPNLRKKPHAPSKGRGPVQRAIRRAFMASGAEVLNSTEIYNWAHGRRRFGRRKSMPFGVYSRTLRTLRAMCEPVGRAPTTGRPWLWRLRNSHEDTR